MEALKEVILEIIVFLIPVAFSLVLCGLVIYVGGFFVDIIRALIKEEDEEFGQTDENIQRDPIENTFKKSKS